MEAGWRELLDEIREAETALQTAHDALTAAVRKSDRQKFADAMERWSAARIRYIAQVQNAGLLIEAMGEELEKRPRVPIGDSSRSFNLAAAAVALFFASMMVVAVKKLLS